jgi:hypothetical protein
LGITTNPSCSMDDVQANCKIRYCCKFAILWLFPCKLQNCILLQGPCLPCSHDGFPCEKCKFEVLFLGRSQHVLDEDCRCSSFKFAKLGYCNDPPQHHDWICLKQ